MKTVKIDRAKWLNALQTAGTSSVLWNKVFNAGCCLGHVCKQISHKTEKQLDDLCSPEEIFIGKSILTDINDGFSVNNQFTDSAIRINDNPYISNKVRESRLIKLFRKNGIKLTFYGKFRSD